MTNDQETNVNVTAMRKRFQKTASLIKQIGTCKFRTQQRQGNNVYQLDIGGMSATYYEREDGKDGYLIIFHAYYSTASASRLQYRKPIDIINGSPELFMTLSELLLEFRR